MLKKCSIPSSATILPASVHQPRVVERDEVHREPGAHRLARLRVAEHDSSPVGDAVDRPLAAGRELHHQQVGAVLAGSSSSSLLQPHRHRARAARTAAGARGRRVGSRMRKPREPDEKTGLKHTGRSGIAELARPRPRPRRAPVTRRNAGAGHAELVRGARSISALSFERRIVSGRGDEHRDVAEAVAVRGEPLEVERRLRQHGVHALALADREDRVGEAGVGAGRTRWNASQSCRPIERSDMSVPTSRTRRSPFSRSPRRSAAVPGAPEAETRTVRSSHERSIRSSASSSRRLSRSASSIARIVSPIVSPG